MSMPVNGGRDLTPLRNPSTGQFSLFDWDTTGNPAFDDTGAYAVMSVLLEELEGYWADPTGKRGSTLHKAKMDITGGPAAVKADAERALAFLVASRQITSATVSVVRVKAGRYDILVNWVNKRGQSQAARLPIGG